MTKGYRDWLPIGCEMQITTELFRCHKQPTKANEKRVSILPTAPEYQSKIGLTNFEILKLSSGLISGLISGIIWD